MKITWLDHDISPVDTPDNTKVKLIGVYNTDTTFVTIYLTIEHQGTEYRLSRYHKRTAVGNNLEALKQRHARSIGDFARKYGQAPIKSIIERFIEWSTNPAYEVLRQIIPQTEPLDNLYQ